MDIKGKTLSGLLWSFIDQFANLGVSFIAGIILARLLSPTEFGLIGMITVFIAVSESFIDSGFKSALIRKKTCTNIDYSTVFYFNLVVGVFLFFVLFFSSTTIAAFFEIPKLKSIVQVLGIILIIDSVTVIQRTILIKRIEFKLQARISVIASFGSGLLAVVMAFNGLGVWSLVFQRVSRQGISSFFLWYWSDWRPLRVFSMDSFKELFGFGSKLLVSGIIDTLYRNIYLLVIGKFFSAQDLGFYTRADEFKRLPSQQISAIMGRVTYPVLSSMQDDKNRLRSSYQKLIRGTMFITFILMIGMASVSESLIISLIGESWRQTILYLQILSFVGMMYPINALNLNMLQVSGRSDLFLKLEVIKKAFAIPVITIGVFFGIKIMLFGMLFNALFSYYLNSYWSGRFIDYSFKQQLVDILPSFGLAIFMGLGVYLCGQALTFDHLTRLFIQIVVGATFIVLFCELIQFRDYIFVKRMVFDKVKEIRRK